jgi:hypothetical protein
MPAARIGPLPDRARSEEGLAIGPPTELGEVYRSRRGSVLVSVLPYAGLVPAPRDGRDVTASSALKCGASSAHQHERAGDHAEAAERGEARVGGSDPVEAPAGEFGEDEQPGTA